jgi:hypothetical protein
VGEWLTISEIHEWRVSNQDWKSFFSSVNFSVLWVNVMMEGFSWWFFVFLFVFFT